MSFQTIYGHFEFRVMSFSLINATTGFMDLMHRFFRSYVNLFAIIFIDDILMYSKSESDHVND